MMYADLNQREAAELKDREITAILPIGATEVHGNHLPLGTDTFLVDALAKKVEERLGEENCVILPTVPYGQVWSLRKAPGSINIPVSYTHLDVYKRQVPDRQGPLESLLSTRN